MKRSWVAPLRDFTRRKDDDSRRPPAISQAEDTTVVIETVAIDDELKLPDRASLIIVLFANVLMQWTFFIIVSSSNEYAQHLGGSSTFSGLVIGIPTAVSALTLIPLMLVDKGGYSIPLNFACGCLVLGNILYALAYRANFLYLILLGRIICGGGFTFWMYAKRYCSDPRIVGIRRRTTLAGWQVLGQGIGFSFGPFAGGLLSKIGYDNAVFNGFTSPGWIMAGAWAAFWVVVRIYFVEVPPAQTPAIPLQPVEEPSARSSTDAEDAQVPPTPAASEPSIATSTVPLVSPTHHMTPGQWGVAATMCWFAMTCFFILGAWESNIPVFTASDAPANPFDFSPFASGNMIALGGACTIPFLLINLHFARRMQDRNTLALGTSVGAAGLLIAISILAAEKVNYGSFFIAWFLVALGFNVASTVTLALLSKQLPGEWNGRISLLIQCSNYTGRVTGAVWGGAGVKVGMLGYVGLQLGYVAVGTVLFMTLWHNLKAKTG